MPLGLTRPFSIVENGVATPWSHSKAFAICFGGILLADLTLSYARHWLSPKSRWFALHGVVNLVLAMECLPDIIVSLRNPIMCMRGELPYSLFPAYLSATLHTYHMLAPWFRPLQTADYIHHLAFAGILGSCQLSYHWGPGSNIFMFFVCGLPGGIDYLMMSAVKEGALSSLTEKYYNNLINVWVLAPGCVGCSFWIYACWAAGNTTQIPPLAIFTCIALCYANGQYYGSQVTASYAVSAGREGMSYGNGC